METRIWRSEEFKFFSEVSSLIDGYNLKLEMYW